MGITLLDGGMGQELLARTTDAPTSLWSAQVMMDHPALVRAVHDDYFAAGAEIATTNTYSVQHDRLQLDDKDHLFRELHELGCSLAAQARDAHGSGRVAGSLGPMGWSYRPDLAPPAEQAAECYAEIARLQAPLVDLFLCETMSSVDQARGALMGAGVVGRPVWLSVSVLDEDGTRLRSGEPVTGLWPLLTEFNVDALLVNCSPPEAVSSALPLLADKNVRLGAYANGFARISAGFGRSSTVKMLEAREDLGPEAYADFADRWIASGTEIIGGCCEVGPAHIAEVARRNTP
jgi:S-methylmethionine-dependent homocysteine/selenocysteine methylase